MRVGLTTPSAINIATIPANYAGSTIPDAGSRPPAYKVTLPSGVDKGTELASARIWLDAHDFKKAGSCINKLLPAFPNDPDLRYWHGELNRLNGRLEDAMADWKIALVEAPSHVQTLLGQADVLRQDGMLEDSLRIVDSVLTRYPEYGTAYAVKAAALYQKSQVNEALETASKGIAQGLHEPTVHLMRGVCLHRLGRRAEAIEAYAMCAAASRYVGPWAMVLWSTALAETGYIRKAYKMVKAAYDLWPNEAVVVEAEKELRKATRYQPWTRWF